jgi:Tol biopolymer transport system component
LLFPCRGTITSNMYRARITIIGILLIRALVLNAATDTGNLLVDSYGKLFLIGTDGTQRAVVDSAVIASLSPDGRNLAFVVDENPRAIPKSSQILFTMPLTSGTRIEISRLSPGEHFRSVGWMPDSSAVVYEGTAGNLFIAPVPASGAAPRNLGSWYQGFSVSPDGTKIAHAVNSPAMGLEILDIAGGQRALIHKTKNIVWDAKFSPDGQWIAYTATLREPPRTKNDDDPDCTPPTIGLHIYSVTKKTDKPVTIAPAPKAWDNVKSFNWSPDSKRLALTLGTTDCDYPGSANGVFVTSIDQKSQIRLSMTDMSFEPVFSPDGTAVAFVDFSEDRATLIRHDLATGAHTLIRRATENNNYYRLLDWK